jgi:hypothetical protein
MNLELKNMTRIQLEPVALAYQYKVYELVKELKATQSMPQEIKQALNTRAGEKVATEA